MHFPRGQVTSTGHRRAEALGVEEGGPRRLQLGSLGTETCDLSSLQGRAAEVDRAWCPNDACGGVPSTCDYACAVHLLR